MKTARIIIAAVIIPTIISCQGGKGTNKLARGDIMKILAAGKYNAAVFGDVGYADPKQVELQKKMSDAINQDPEWFADYKAKNDMPLPYSPKLGLTMQEYKELLELNKNNRPMLKQTGGAVIRVISDRNTIRFKANGMLAFFNNVEIHFKNNTVEFNKRELPYLKDENADDTTNIFRSIWHGYSWQFLDPENALLIPRKDYHEKSVAIYKFTVGKLDTNDQPIIIIKGIEYRDGKRVFYFEAPIFLLPYSES